MRKKISIGIDLGTDTIKIVSLEKGKESYFLKSVGMFSYHGDKERLRKFFSEVDFGTKDVRINIDDPSLKIRRLDLPLMPDSDIAEAAKWGLKDTIDGEVDEFAFRHIIIDPMNISVEKKIPLIMFAVKNKAIEDLYQLSRDVGFPRPKVIEPNAAALACVFDNAKGLVRESFSALIAMGRLQSFFTIMGKKGLVYSRPLGGCSENNLVDQVSRDAGLSKDVAEKGVKEFAKGENKASDPKLQGTVARFFSGVAIEVQRSIDGFSTMFNRTPIANIYFCGRAVYYDQMMPSVSAALNIPVRLFDPFENIDISSFDSDKFNATKPMFAIACGLAVD